MIAQHVRKEEGRKALIIKYHVNAIKISNFISAVDSCYVVLKKACNIMITYLKISLGLNMIKMSNCLFFFCKYFLSITMSSNIYSATTIEGPCPHSSEGFFI